MSATFSNELAVHMFLDTHESALAVPGKNGEPLSPAESTAATKVYRRPVPLNKTGSYTFRGSFSEIIQREKEDQETEAEREMYDALFPTKIETKETKTFYANPIHDDDEAAPTEAYVIRDPEEDELMRPVRTFSMRLTGLVFKMFSSEQSEDNETPARSKSATPSDSRKSSRSTSVLGRDKSSGTKKSNPAEDSEHEDSQPQRTARSRSVRLMKRLTGQVSESGADENQRARSVRISMKIKKLLFSQ